MPLTNEDNLRLNVLLRQNLYALHIDESKMLVSALTERGEAEISLNANCRDEKYISMVKEVISTYVLGSPIGYPVFIHRWTRMGQSRKAESLQNLLKLGEPEAVVAVANTKGLPVSVARHVWWAMPTEDMARTLLRHRSVIEDELGQELATFLMEFLPFESEAMRIVETVSLLMQHGVLSEDDRQRLWKKATHKSAYYPGFLISAVDNLPLKVPEHKDYRDISRQLAALIEQDNAAARKLLWCFSEQGQSFLHIIKLALKRPSQQDVIVTLFNAIGFQFSELGLSRSFRSIDDLQSYNDDLYHGAVSEDDRPLAEKLGQINRRCPERKESLLAMLGLAQISETLLDPLFGGTDCLGSVMRKRIKPVSEPLLKMVEELDGG